MTHLLLVKTNGVAFFNPRCRAKDWSMTSLAASPAAPDPPKGHTPLAFDPLPPILNDNGTFFLEVRMPSSMDV